jgi:branched-chain amino acid transport system permease protein
LSGVNLRSIAAVVALFGLLLALPWWAGDQYQLHLAALIAVYWILVAGLNLVVGFTGQLSIGHVGLLAIGAYAFAILAGRYEWSPWVALTASGGIGGVCGLMLGLPSLRLPGFYFAMATMAFALIVAELTLALGNLTGGGVGLAVPGFPAPFETATGFYLLLLGIAAFVTWLTWNVARFPWGRALVAIRDNPVAAESVGVPVFRMKLAVFVLSGVSAGVAGALFASLQSYITPDTFVFELGLFFFVCIIIGGRGSILGPLAGTAILTALPELVAPLAKLGTLFYGLLLLAVVLLVPEGIGRLFSLLLARFRPRTAARNVLQPDIERLAAAVRKGQQA